MTDADNTPHHATTSGDGSAHGAAPSGGPIREEDRAPMGLTIRVFIYLVGVHFIAAFLFLLFYLAGAK
ncbi:hypothetical protein SBI_02929 [Streptomyces bingchenggensis BCW-1]|uniref:Small hydrophobic protein n=1 Tax=Streptomyces bingchenggensis (strain BCW-1) TaxID=749414 RepID=D7C4J9_STRBB|nr:MULTISPECIES: DUF6126 family protein [Streptomyces]ADI06050.1 hypothetical protein SBI_02929 [Streptomyces bingchenggensis BCW-1]